ncbi:hypothetical protein AAFP35_24135 [Gordonia sp. CPCC 206044]|uniref:hypothetical protein n=1 Tax=Gordonia sp. CPCC 206044 TaxID=3140793 RepID=UPI003AF35BC7
MTLDTDKRDTSAEGVTTAKGESAPKTEESSPSGRRQLTISVRSLLISLGAVIVIAALVALIFEVVNTRHDLSDLRSQTSDRATAERLAGDYAVRAATLDYKDLTPWIAAMKKGVSPDLQKQYDVVGSTMEQVLTPLRMQTSADLVVAKTVKASGDNYRVEAVVNVNTKTVQTPNGGSTTAVYGITLDKDKDWLITSVGDPTSAIGQNLGTQAGGDAGAPAADQPPNPAPGAPGAPTDGTPGN